jgi:desulfoferrodoxin (superoxide reductase-like protein)
VTALHLIFHFQITFLSFGSDFDRKEGERTLGKEFLIEFGILEYVYGIFLPDRILPLKASIPEDLRSNTNARYVWVNPMDKAGSKFLIASVSLILVAILFLNNAGTAIANVPTVLQIVNISQGSDGKIRLEITHQNPSANHYVDMIEVQVNGVTAESPTQSTQQFSQQPQTTDPFTVELDLGTLQGAPRASVKARAHCNIHGWSDWSQTIAVPEFPTVAVVTSTLIMTMLVSGAGNTVGRTRKTAEPANHQFDSEGNYHTAG